MNPSQPQPQQPQPEMSQPIQQAYPPPQTIVVGIGFANQCPFCRRGVMVEQVSMLGIILAIVFFPLLLCFSFIFCFMRTQRCTVCGASIDQAYGDFRRNHGKMNPQQSQPQFQPQSQPQSHPQSQTSQMQMMNPAGPTVVVGVGVGGQFCPYCRTGVMFTNWNICGIVLAVIFFPCGIICLLCMSTRTCPSCGATVRYC